MTAMLVLLTVYLKGKLENWVSFHPVSMDFYLPIIYIELLFRFFTTFGQDSIHEHEPLESCFIFLICRYDLYAFRMMQDVFQKLKAKLLKNDIILE